MILTCVQVFEPNVYSKLYQYKDQICGPSIYSYGRDDWEEKRLKIVVEDLLNSAGVLNYTAASTLLSLLFPRLQSILKESRNIGGYYDDRETRAHKNISNRACFDRYFQFVLEDKAISSSQFNDIIFHDDESEVLAKLELFYSNGKIVSLIDEISAFVSTKDTFTIPHERIELLINCLARKCGGYEAKYEGLFVGPIDYQISYCILDMIATIGPEKKYQTLKALFDNKESHPTVLAHVLDFLETEHGRFTEKDAVDKKTITLEELKDLEQLFVESCNNALQSDETSWDAKELDFIWLLGKIQPDSIKTIRSRVKKDVVLLAFIISSMAARGTILSNVQQKTWKFNTTFISPYLDIKDAYCRITAFSKEKQFKELPNSVQKDLIAFILYQEKSVKESQDSYSDSVLEEEVMKKMSEYGL